MFWNNGFCIYCYQNSKIKTLWILAKHILSFFAVEILNGTVKTYSSESLA
jgi:hypothetical protein